MQTNRKSDIPITPTVFVIYIPLLKSPAVLFVFLLDWFEQSISIKQKHNDFKRNTFWGLTNQHFNQCTCNNKETP